MGRYLAGLFELLESWLDAWGRHALGAIEAALRYKTLDLPRICFVLNPVLAPSDNSIEYATLLCVVGAWAEPRPDVELVVFADRCLEPV